MWWEGMRKTRNRLGPIKGRLGASGLRTMRKRRRQTGQRSLIKEDYEKFCSLIRNKFLIRLSGFSSPLQETINNNHRSAPHSRAASLLNDPQRFSRLTGELPDVSHWLTQPRPTSECAQAVLLSLPALVATQHTDHQQTVRHPRASTGSDFPRTYKDMDGL